MAITLQRFASGDTDYIAKLNVDMNTIEDAINLLQLMATGGGTDPGTSFTNFLGTLFQNQTTLIGQGAYLPTANGTSLDIAAGGAFIASSQAIVQSIASSLSFVGVQAGTYYIVLDNTGAPTRSSSPTDALYSVVWNGVDFGDITQLAPAMFSASEENAARESTVYTETYTSLDARLEHAEQVAQDAADAIYELPGSLATVATTGNYADLTNRPVRKVGCSLDGGGVPISTGIKGAIQVDFAGTIIGWSIIADITGSISVEVDKKASSAPPSAPAIPNTTTDKISASAPVALSSAQSAAAAEAGVSTWTTSVAQWDVFQFYVTSVTAVTKATLYLRIQEA